MRALIDPSKKRPLLSIEEEDPDNLDAAVHQRFPTDRATLENLDETFEERDEDEDADEVESENRAPIRRFGTQMGLFSKFTNAPTLDEFTLAGLLAQIEDTGKNEEEATPLAPPPLQSVWSFRGSLYDSELAQQIIAKKTEQKSWYKAAIIVAIFSTQFAGTLELVYVSPLFTRMRLPPLIDATVWIFPVIFITLVTPFINILTSHLNYERITHMLIIVFSILGCLIFSFLDQVLPKITTDPEEMRVWTIYFGFLAFCLLDVSNEMTIMVQNKIVLADEILGVEFNNLLSGVASVAKSLAYLMASLEAFGIDFSRGIIPRNLDLCFLVAAIFLLTSLILSIIYQTAPTKGYKGPVMKKLRQLKPAHFLPPVRRIFKGTKSIKLLVSSHFFGSAGMLMLVVYVTIWAGTEIFEGDGRAPDGSEEFHNFNIGVAWGSFSLFLSSILSGCTKYLIFKATQPQNLSKDRIKALYLWSLVLAASITVICQLTGTKNWWFLLLALSGPAFETFHVLPGILGDFAEIKDTNKHLGHYRHLLSFSLFYAQALMFLIVPLFFLLFPDRNDNVWGMLAAAASTFVAAIIGKFL